MNDICTPAVWIDKPTLVSIKSLYLRYYLIISRRRPKVCVMYPSNNTGVCEPILFYLFTCI